MGRTIDENVLGLLSDKTIFFIVGSFKSGTTWLQKLFDSHPDVCCDGESHFFNVLAPRVCEVLNQHNRHIDSKNKMLNRTDAGYPRVNQNDTDFFIKMMLSTFLFKQMGGKDYKAVGEKTPDHIQSVRYIKKIIPKAKFIHVVRDPRDVIVSGWFHIYRDTPKWAKETFPEIQKYADVVSKSWDKIIKLAQQYKKDYPNDFLEFRYENMIDNPRPCVESVFKFLDVSSDKSLVDSCIDAASFKNLTKGRKAGEEDRSSHFRKGVVGDWQNHLNQQALDVCKRNASASAQLFNYSL